MSSTDRSRGPRSRGAVGARRSRRLLSLRDTARAMSQENVDVVLKSPLANRGVIDAETGSRLPPPRDRACAKANSRASTSPATIVISAPASSTQNPGPGSASPICLARREPRRRHVREVADQHDRERDRPQRGACQRGQGVLGPPCEKRGHAGRDPDHGHRRRPFAGRLRARDQLAAQIDEPHDVEEAGQHEQRRADEGRHRGERQAVRRELIPAGSPGPSEPGRASVPERPRISRQAGRSGPFWALNALLTSPKSSRSYICAAVSAEPPVSGGSGRRWEGILEMETETR